MASRIVRVPFNLIAIEEDGYHLTVNVNINGKDALVLIDTGASRSVFDISRIKNFTIEQSFEQHDKLSTGLGTNSMVTHTTNLTNFKIGDLLLKSFEAVLLDLTHVNESYSKLGLDQIDGVFGSDLLHRYKAIVDYGKCELQLTPTTV